MIKKLYKTKKRSLTAVFLTLLLMSGLITTAYAYDGITGNMDNTIKRESGYVLGAGYSSNPVTTLHSLASADGGYLALGYSTANVEGMYDNAAYAQSGSILTKVMESASGFNEQWKLSLYVKSIDSSMDFTLDASIPRFLKINLGDMVALSDGSYLAAGYLGMTQSRYVPSSYAGGTYKVTIGSVMNKDGNLQGENTFDVDWHISNSDSVQSNDAIMVKLDSDGNIEWIKTMEGYSAESIISLTPLSDGGYALVGQTTLDENTDASYDNGDFDGAAAGIPVSPYGEDKQASNAFIAEYTKDGELEWLKMAGGSYDDAFTGITETSDHKLAVVGYTGSGDMKDSAGNIISTHDSVSTREAGIKVYEAIAGIINEDGSFEWIKSTGGSGADIFTDVAADNKGGFIVSGNTKSADGDFEGLSLGSLDAVAASFTADGQRNWLKTYGGSLDDIFKSVSVSPEGGFVFGGLSGSSDGMMADTTISGGVDFVIVNVRDNGDVWRVTPLGGSGDESTSPYSAITASSPQYQYGGSNLLATPTGYLMAGSSMSADGLFTANTSGTYDGVIALASFDYDGDGVPDSLDYYPADPELSQAPAEALDLTAAPVVTFGDSGSSSCEITSSDILAPYVGEDGETHNILGTDNVSITLAGGTVTMPVQSLNSLLAQAGGVLNFSIEDVSGTNLSSINSLLGDDKNILAFDITLTDAAGNAIHELPADIMVTMDIPSGVNVSDAGRLALNYYNADTGKLEAISSADIKLADGNKVSFKIPHLSEYVISQKADTVAADVTGGGLQGSNSTLTNGPSTGDSNNGYIWIAGIVAALGAVVICTYKLRKKSV